MRATLPIIQYNAETIRQEMINFLSATKDKLQALCRQKKYTWENLFTPLDALQAEFNERFDAPIDLSYRFNSSKSVNEDFDFLTQKATELEEIIFTNTDLFRALEILKKQSYKSFSDAQKKAIDKTLLEFEGWGIHLSKKKQEKIHTLKQKLNTLTNKFENLNRNDSDSSGKLIHIKNAKLLANLPNAIQELGIENAKKAGKSGLLLSQHMLFEYIQYIKDSALRKKIYNAATGHPDVDKSDLIQEIMECRLTLAKTLGFENYAEYALNNKAFKNPEEIVNFLQNSIKKLEPYTDNETLQYMEFVQNELGLEEIEPWDEAYAVHEYQKYLCTHSDKPMVMSHEEKTVWQQLTQSMNKLYNVNLHPFETETWHKDVQCFRVTKGKNETIGFLYYDLYGREGKLTGGWTTPILSRRRLENGDIQLPVAVIGCNFTPPARKQSAIYTQDESNTLFHETGHALQHILTKMDIYSVSGISLPWDNVEVASTFFEHWSSQGALADIIPTPLPIQQVVNQARTFLQDFLLHYKYQGGSVEKTLEKASREYKIDLTASMDQDTHVFGTGGSEYGSCLYTYLLANAIAAFLFAPFKVNGVFNRELGQRLEETFLQLGGSKNPVVMYCDFMGVDPETLQPKNNNDSAQSNQNPKKTQYKLGFFANKISGKRRDREDDHKNIPELAYQG